MTTTRRGFLGTAIGALGAGLAAGCSERLPRFLIPYAIPPDDSVPGIARFYRTVCRECPAGCGVTARVREGRVVKLEGSVDHPVSRGALCPRGQAAIEGLYAPERLGTPRSATAELGWDQAEHALAEGIGRALEAKQLVVVLSRPEPGSLGTLFRTWLTALGQAPAQVVTFDAMARGWLLEGNRRAFGVATQPRLDLGAAKLVISIGDDFVEDGSAVEHARGLAELRAAGGRFVYVGPRMSLTAAAADEWLSTEPGAEIFLVLGLARQVLELAGAPPGLAAGMLEGRLAPYDLATVASRTKLDTATIVRLARQLADARPSLCVGPGRAVAGANAAELAESVAVLNAVAGNLGRTLHVPARPDAPWAAASMTLAELERRAMAGEVGALIVHHANPHGYGPAFAGLAKAIERVPFIAAFVNQLDDTARHAHLVLPDHHFLESWSDVTPRAGVTGVQQPAMTPVLGTRAAADELLVAARALGKTTGLPEGSFAELVRAAFDEPAIERGGRFTEVADERVTLAAEVLTGAAVGAALRGPSDGFPLIVAPTLRHLDGLPPRSMLLQELPDPLTSYSWTGWVELHPTTAAGLGVETGDVLALASAAGHTDLPVHVTERVRAGMVAVPVGHALALLDDQRAPMAGGRETLPLGFVTRVHARRTGERIQPPHVRGGASQHGRQLARKVPRALPQLPKAAPLPSMYPPVEHPVHRWGLAIDLDSCNGCGACIAACYVENNLPVVGAVEVARGRAMSWLDVQVFSEKAPAGPEVSFLPLMCQHCTNAPCESVCPTEATYHTKEGLNAQVYARCVGTRYCENNCPYDVRRFNFFDWRREGQAKLALNPDVTVRERGVTEKCTMCVQRIRGGEEQAKIEGRPVRDGEIVSACAATCPARAITFGDLKDPASAISKLAASGRAYHLLEELNTQPGVVYLARRRDKVDK
jgi:molybdopterin-containing oxidoreductase family iron-sulfur binding subunit